MKNQTYLRYEKKPVVKIIARSWFKFELLLLSLAAAGFALAPAGRAECKEGCANDGDGIDSNAFLGEEALASLTTGGANTAIGYRTLNFITTQSGNTGWE